MFHRLPSIRTAWLPVLALALLLASSIIALAAGDPVRLGEDVLTQSRGGSPFRTLATKSCDMLQQNYFCAQVNDACAACSTSEYDDLAPGGAFYMRKDAPQSCGTNDLGVCDANLDCVWFFPPQSLGNCATPPKQVQSQ